MAGNLDFYFFYGSIHSYLSVMRIGALASAAHVEVRWQPFNLREILIEQNNTAFTKNEVKMNYFWHDVERRARRYKIPFAGRVSVITSSGFLPRSINHQRRSSRARRAQKASVC